MRRYFSCERIGFKNHLFNLSRLIRIIVNLCPDISNALSISILVIDTEFEGAVVFKNGIQIFI